MRNATDIHPKVAAGLASAVATVAAVAAVGVDMTIVVFTVLGIEATVGTLVGIGGFLLGAYGWPEAPADELEGIPADVDEGAEKDDGP